MALEMKEKMVAFIDVLGFRDLVEQRADEKLSLYFDTVRLQLQQQTADKVDINAEYMMFSDSAVIAADFKDDINHLCKFLLLIRNIQFELAKIGIWLRGGIAIDLLDLNTEESRVVGKGLNRAYDLERLAKYPRVIMDPSIVDRFKLTRDVFLSKVNDRANVHESGKYLVFDHFASQGLSEFPHDGLFVNFLAPLMWVDEVQAKMIYEAVRSSCNKKQQTYYKYRWLIDYATRVAMLAPYPMLPHMFRAL